jgi:beta-carotene 15,15'-dioxygenase
VKSPSLSPSPSPSLGSARSATVDIAERWLGGQGSAYVVAALLLCGAAASGWVTPRVELTLFVLALATTGMLHGGGDHVALRELAVHRVPWLLALGLYVAAALASSALCLRFPLMGAALFLAASAWHFGASDALSDGAARLPEIVARGLLPIATPLTRHPEPSLRALATLSGADPVTLAPLGDLAPFGLGAAAVAATLAAARSEAWRGSVAIELGAGFLVFSVAPPLAAFSVYFAVCHGSRHLIREGLVHSPTRVVDGLIEAVRRALGPTAIALVAVTALALGPRAALEPWLGAGLAVLAALTLPHVLVTGWVDHLRRRRRSAT